ncbi:hypothetical protein H8959_004232, partial [Pygathrix nigripes]
YHTSPNTHLLAPALHRAEMNGANTCGSLSNRPLGSPSPPPAAGPRLLLPGRLGVLREGAGERGPWGGQGEGREDWASSSRRARPRRRRMGCGGSRADAIEPRYYESWTRETESTWLTYTDSDAPPSAAAPDSGPEAGGLHAG